MARTRFNPDGSPSSDGADVKNIVRYLAKNAAGLAAGADSVENVNAELAALVQSGYELVNTHFIGENPEGIGMIYVLVKG